MNILIVKLSAIGDVIHTLPALNAIRRYYPDAVISWLVEEAAAPLVTGHEALDRVIISGRKRWFKGLGKRGSRIKNIRNIFNFIKTLRDTHYDIIIDFQQLLKSGIPVWLAKGRLKTGFDKGMEHMEQSHLFLNRRLPPVSMEIHALKRCLMIPDALGIPVSEIRYRLPVNNKDHQAIEDLLLRHGVKKNKIIVAVNPVAQWETKLWQTHKFAELADRLVDDYGAEVVFTGGSDDAPITGEILSQMKKNAVDLAGKTTLMTLAALYQKTGLVISTDTGPMHLAAAVRTPVIALFGPTAPWRTGPFGYGHRVIRTGVRCSPCFKRHCPGYGGICMTKISTADVLAAVHKTGIFSETVPS